MENKQLLLRNETNIYIKKKKKPRRKNQKSYRNPKWLQISNSRINNLLAPTHDGNRGTMFTKLCWYFKPNSWSTSCYQSYLSFQDICFKWWFHLILDSWFSILDQTKIALSLSRTPPGGRIFSCLLLYMEELVPHRRSKRVSYRFGPPSFLFRSF